MNNVLPVLLESVYGLTVYGRRFVDVQITKHGRLHKSQCILSFLYKTCRSLAIVMQINDGTQPSYRGLIIHVPKN